MNFKLDRHAIILLLLLAFSAFPAWPAETKPSPAALETSPHYLKKYHFTEDWFTSRLPLWKEVLRPYQGNPDLHYLEIGVFEGRAAIWMLENVLTHPTSRLTGIDIFPGNLKEQFLTNIQISGFAEKVTTLTGRSQVELMKLPPESFDFIYVDGSHAARDVLADAVESWELLKTGGLLIFDDYQSEPQFPAELLPRTAIDAFITAYRDSLEIIHRDFQVILRKRENPCLLEFACSPIGKARYHWMRKKLYDAETGKPIEISGKDEAWIRELIKSREWGDNRYLMEPRVLKDEAFIALTEKIGLEMSRVGERRPFRKLEMVMRDYFSKLPRVFRIEGAKWRKRFGV